MRTLNLVAENLLENNFVLAVNDNFLVASNKDYHKVNVYKKTGTIEVIDAISDRILRSFRLHNFNLKTLKHHAKKSIQ